MNEPHVNVQMSEAVLERLIASGALCAADVCCQGPADKKRMIAICKRCSARPFVSGRDRYRRIDQRCPRA